MAQKCHFALAKTKKNEKKVMVVAWVAASVAATIAATIAASVVANVAATGGHTHQPRLDIFSFFLYSDSPVTIKEKVIEGY